MDNASCRCALDGLLFIEDILNDNIKVWYVQWCYYYALSSDKIYLFGEEIYFIRLIYSGIYVQIF